MTENENVGATLYILGDRGQTIDGSANDIRGRQVNDKNGDGIGKVADLLVDDAAGKVRFLLVEHGGFLGFGETRSLIPVDAVARVSESHVYVDQSREHVAAAPGNTPDLVDDQPYHANIYNYYGYTPYWGQAGGMYPVAPGSDRLQSPGATKLTHPAFDVASQR